MYAVELQSRMRTIATGLDIYVLSTATIAGKSQKKKDIHGIIENGNAVSESKKRQSSSWKKKTKGCVQGCRSWKGASSENVNQNFNHRNDYHAVAGRCTGGGDAENHMT